MSEPPATDAHELPLLARPRVVGRLVDAAVLFFLGLLYPLNVLGIPLYCVVGVRRRTLGQRVADLRVVARDGTALGWRRALLRAMPMMTLMTLATLPVWGDSLFLAGALALAGVEVSLFRQGWRYGLGDLMAGTATVRQPRDAPAPPEATA